MNRLRRITSALFVIGAVALPSAALADGRFGKRNDNHRDGRHGDYRGGHRGGGAHIEVRVPRPPRPPGRSGGRYELHTVSRWVDGHYVKDWVPERCHEVRRRGPRHKRMHCEGGYYTDRFVPGHYQQVEEWVWVPAPRRPHWQVSVYGR